MFAGRLKLFRKAKGQLRTLFEHPENCVVIHYSCESFYDRPQGRSPRITSIAARNLDSGQTASFSIHKIAERRHVSFTTIEAHYDALERAMLDEFYDFARVHNGHKWIHWNMRDQNYGFPAIEHRYQVLGGGHPTQLPEERKYDLSRILIDLYGPGYIPHPRLTKLMEANSIAAKDMMTGAQEADAFDQKNYVALHQSTLRKVDVLANIAMRTFEGRLKTSARWHEQYGFSPPGIWEMIKDHWLLDLLGLIATLAGIAGVFVGN